MGLIGFFQEYPSLGNATIPIHGTGETQNIPSDGIFMTPVIPISGISLYQIIPNAVNLFSQFFPIVEISQSPLFHNNGILLSQIWDFAVTKLPQYRDFIATATKYQYYCPLSLLTDRS